MGNIGNHDLTDGGIEYILSLGNYFFGKINSRIQPLRVCRANALKDSFVTMTGEIKCSLRSRLISCCHGI